MYVLRDINLPITEIAFKIISENYKQDKTHVIKEMEAVINKAIQIKDPDWLWGICCVVEKLELQQNDFSSNEFWKLLSTCGYWNE